MFHSIIIFWSLKTISNYTSIFISQRYLKCSNFKTKFFSTFIHLKYVIFHKIQAKILTMPHNASSTLMTHHPFLCDIHADTYNLKCDFRCCFKGSAFSSSSSWIVTMPTTYISLLYHVSTGCFFMSSKIRAHLFMILLHIARYLMHFVNFYFILNHQLFPPLGWTLVLWNQVHLFCCCYCFILLPRKMPGPHWHSTDICWKKVQRAEEKKGRKK